MLSPGVSLTEMTSAHEFQGFVCIVSGCERKIECAVHEAHNSQLPPWME